MEIHPLILLGEIHENAQHFKYISAKKNVFTCLDGLVVECKTSYQKGTDSNPPFISMVPYLKLCLTITHPLPLHLHQIAKKSTTTFAFPSVS